MKTKLKLIPTAFLLTFSVFLFTGVYTLETKLKQGDNSLLIENFPYIAQSHPNTCGAAALAMLLQYYDVSVTEKDFITEYPQIYQTGFYIPWLWEYSKKKGLKTESGSGDIEKVKNFIANDTPVLVYQFSYKGGRQHFRIVIGYDDKNQVFILDDPTPQMGKESRISYADFEELWQLPYFTSPTEARRKFYLIIIK